MRQGLLLQLAVFDDRCWDAGGRFSEIGRQVADIDAYDLIDHIYDAAGDVLPWQELGERIGVCFGTEMVNILLDGAGAVPQLLANAGAWVQSDYFSYYHKHDLWREGGMRLLSDCHDPRRVFINEDLVAYDTLRESEFYRDFARHIGAFHAMIGVAELGPAGIMILSQFRPEDAPPFSEENRRMMRLLMPHLNRAMRLRQALAQAKASGAAGQSALDALSAAVAVVDADLRLVTVNRALETLAARGDGVRLRRAGPGGVTRLQAAREADQALLERLVVSATRGGAGGGVRLARARGLPIAGLVMPLPARLAPGGVAARALAPHLALVMLRDLDAKIEMASGVLEMLFGLTAAEAAVALASVRGATADAIAAARGTSIETVRKQIRAILEKSQAASLRDLTRMVASLV